jgi:hypothetical protein
MKFTNESNLPDHITAVLQGAYLNDAYDGPRGDKTITVTQLIGPAQKLVLEKRHEKDLEMDVIDTIPALLGQALHHILERAGNVAPAHVPERRLSAVHDGWIISGKADLYETASHTLVDYKNSSVWTYVFGKPEWVQQLNVYRWLLERNGHQPKGLAVVLFCGDWRRGEARKNPDYPARVVNIQIPMWTMDEATAFIDKRLALHRAAQDGKIPPCSEEERWSKPTKYAIMRTGRKTAVSLHDAKPECPPGHYIETRAGESVRCKDYCNAAPFCAQWKADPTNPVNSEVTTSA